MRCLTLADTLKQQGAEISFICRAHQGNLISFVEAKGFQVATLNATEDEMQEDQNDQATLFHAKWLGVSQRQDADECRGILEQIKPDWLIVDHYAIDQAWQNALQECYNKLLVIDDLADRVHQCDVLLDQTFGREKSDYQPLVPSECQLLLGSQFALLRPEFAQWREYSLQRRQNPEFKRLLITMGGVDSDNVTGQVLDALRTADFLGDITITIIMGSTAPHLDKVRDKAESMPCLTEVKVGVDNMAEIMANADFAIGAAGATTWERCALGLPAIHVVLAENQRKIAFTLAEKGVAMAIEKADLFPSLSSLLAKSVSQLTHLSERASLIVDGQGCPLVVTNMMKFEA